MTLTAPLLIVGLPDPEMDALRRRMPGHDMISVPDGPRAVACLRTWGHGIPAALLDADALKDELEELVVYLKGTFPEASIALLGKVEDEGEGFNVSSLDDPTNDPEGHATVRTEAGKRRGDLGIHLIRNLMDEVLYNDRGNVVMLTKRLNPHLT